MVSLRSSYSTHADEWTSSSSHACRAHYWWPAANLISASFFGQNDSPSVFGVWAESTQRVRRLKSFTPGIPEHVAAYQWLALSCGSACKLRTARLIRLSAHTITITQSPSNKSESLAVLLHIAKVKSASRHVLSPAVLLVPKVSSRSSID